MPIVSLNTLYSRFKKGLKPTDQHFWDVFDSFWHKSGMIPSNVIDGLQELLNSKMDKKAAVASDQVGIYDPAKSYVYDALLSEYVSFSNPNSENDQFKTEKFYRLKENAPAGENPETHPTHWAYQGTTIGEITIDDVVGLREELDWLSENAGGTGLTPEQLVILESFVAPFSFSGLDSFPLNFGRKVLITSVTKATNITEIRAGKNGATPSDITPQLPLTIEATDNMVFEATYDRESNSNFTLIGKKL